jgi:lysine/ornithine N-monooxygenase
MEDKEFHDKVNDMFEEKLRRYVVRIKDVANDKILAESDMNYDRVLFDSNLNIYKIENGVPVLVENQNFKAILL